MSVIQELAEIAKRTSVLLGFDTPTSFLILLRKMLEVTDPPSKVIEDVRAELNARDIGVNGTLRYLLENPPSPMFPCACDDELKVTSVPCPTCVRVRYPSADALRRAMPPRTPLEQELAHVPRLARSTEAGPPPTHLAPMVRLSDKPPSSAAKVSSQPGNRVRVDIDGQVFDFDFVQACDLCENIAAALPAIRWGEGSGLHPGEVVLEQSHPGSRRAAVRPVSGGIALRAVECDGQPAGGSIFLRGGAVDALIAALNAAHIQQGDVLLADLTAAGATRFAPAHLTARRCSSTHLQLLDDGLVTADWWPTTGKARAAGPSGGVAAPHKIFTVDALVEWLKGL